MVHKGNLHRSANDDSLEQAVPVIHTQATDQQEQDYSPMVIAKNLQEIEKLSSLQQDWDGYGASAMDSTLFQKAKALLEKIPIRVLSIPTSSGSIQLEVHRENSSLEIEVLPDTFSLLFEKNGMFQEIGTPDLSEVLKLVQEVDAAT